MPRRPGRRHPGSPWRIPEGPHRGSGWAATVAGGRHNVAVLLQEIAETSDAVASTAARLAKVERLAACLHRLDPAEVAVAVAFLSGELRQRQIGVGWAALREAPAPAGAASLTLAEVDAAFGRIGRQAGAGSQAERRRLLAELLGRCTPHEQRFLIQLLSGELRQGALDGVMAEAVARAAGVPAAEVRRALMLRGSLGAVAEAALAHGAAGLRSFHLQVGRPLQPMLAQTASSVEAALERIRPAAVEWKLDGARIQLHRDGADVRVFTRTLDDITGRVPELVEAALALPVRAAVLDGEAIALRDDGRPHPFQVTAGRVGSRLEVERLRGSLPLTPFLFDALHLDGEDLLDLGGAERHQALVAAVPAALRIPRTVTGEVAAAAAFLHDTLARGHEGVVVKSLAAPYEAGRRGAGWVKVKPVHTLDLVVLAAEWGHGRRRGWLSNLHLGARDPGGGFVMLGKTFKGLTDELLAWQTERLLELAAGATDQWVVHVRPELVVEVAFDGVQASPRYPGGVALRFARVLRYRPDKRAADADTIAEVRAIHAGAPPR
jgi:ATP-dependent DNA ligase I